MENLNYGGFLGRVYFQEMAMEGVNSMCQQ
jgi:hypothetical protein